MTVSAKEKRISRSVHCRYLRYCGLVEAARANIEYNPYHTKLNAPLLREMQRLKVPAGWSSWRELGRDLLARHYVSSVELPPSTVPGFDAFYGPRHQVTDDAVKLSSGNVNCKTLLWEYALVVDHFERRFAEPVRHAALNGVTVTVRGDVLFNGLDGDPGHIYGAIRMVEELSRPVDLGVAHVSVKSRVAALRKWCRGLLAFYSKPLDPDIISDPQKLHAVIAVLGELQTALA